MKKMTVLSKFNNSKTQIQNFSNLENSTSQHFKHNKQVFPIDCAANEMVKIEVKNWVA